MILKYFFVSKAAPMSFEPLSFFFSFVFCPEMTERLIRCCNPITKYLAWCVFIVKIHVCLFLQTCETREVTHYQYTEWAEHAIPLVHDLLEFIWRVKAAPSDLRGPLLVHCRYTAVHPFFRVMCTATIISRHTKPKTKQATIK